MKKNWLKAAGLLAISTIAAAPGMAADHIDGPAAIDNPDADLADVYAWMSPDASKVNLAVTWFPFVTPDAPLDPNTLFVFHVNSASAFGEGQTETQIICGFEGGDAAETVSCWIGDEDFVTGPANDRAGATSASGRVKVFAGDVNDPFFFNLDGFNKTTEIVAGAASSLTFDEAGCPQLDEATSMALVTQLQSDADGSPATDDLAGSNVQAIVLQLDKALLTKGGPILGVWVSSHARQ